MRVGGLVLCAVLVAAALPAAAQQLSVGSKKFTESVLLGELLRLLASETGAEVEHRRELGGTQVLWKALLRGEIDAYPEYTGTIRQEILGGAGPADERQAQRSL